MNRIAILPFVLCGGFLFACCASGGEKDSGVENIAGIDGGVCSGVDCRCPGPVKPNIQGCLIGPHSLKAQEDKGACPDDMVLIDGQFCWISPPCLFCVDGVGNKVHCGKFGGQGDRCGEFSRDVQCKSKEEHLRFCIDKYEYPDVEGRIPQDWLSYTESEKIAKERGRRLCLDKEWSLAAQGPNRHPIPYGNGFIRAIGQSVCNMDHTPSINVMKATSPNTETAKTLRALLVPSGSMPDCHSDYGVYDLPANTDEWVKNTTNNGYPTGLMGGHVFGVRNSSFAETTGHNGKIFAWYETNFRECKDAAF